MKYKIKDAEGNNFEVEEVISDEGTTEVSTKHETSENACDETLTSEEILALKKLAANADKLVALLSTTDEEPSDEPSDETKTVESTTNEETSVTDSFGSLEKPTTKDSTNNSSDLSIEINDAWAKRFKRK